MYIIPVFLPEISITVTYINTNKYEMTINGQTYCVSGTLNDTDGGDTSQLTCNIDGVSSDATLVNNQETLHLFSCVSKLLTCALLF